MINSHKKIEVDENGKPSNIIIPWDEYCDIEERLGFGLNKEEKEQLRQAQRDRVTNKKNWYVELDDV